MISRWGMSFTYLSHYRFPFCRFHPYIPSGKDIISVLFTSLQSNVYYFVSSFQP